MDAVRHLVSNLCIKIQFFLLPIDSYESVTRKYTYNLQPEINKLLKEFREVLDEYTNNDGKERIIMTEGNNNPISIIIFIQKINSESFVKIFHARQNGWRGIIYTPNES